MIKTLLITAGDLLFAKVSNIFRNPDTQVDRPEVFTVLKARVLRIVARKLFLRHFQ